MNNVIGQKRFFFFLYQYINIYCKTSFFIYILYKSYMIIRTVPSQFYIFIYIHIDCICVFIYMNIYIYIYYKYVVHEVTIFNQIHYKY